MNFPMAAIMIAFHCKKKNQECFIRISYSRLYSLPKLLEFM